MAAPGRELAVDLRVIRTPAPRPPQGAEVCLAEPCWPSGVQGGGSVWEVRGLRD